MIERKYKASDKKYLLPSPLQICEVPSSHTIFPEFPVFMEEAKLSCKGLWAATLWIEFSSLYLLQLYWAFSYGKALIPSVPALFSAHEIICITSSRKGDYTAFRACSSLSVPVSFRVQCFQALGEILSPARPECINPD